MDKRDVARTLSEIAVLLELKGENPFRIRAYENAARAIRELDEPLDRLLAEGRLRAVPGIGAAIEKKIADYAATGAVPLHQKLLDEIPASALELLAVPGLGPRRARAAYAEAGIDSLDALEAAAIDGRLAVIFSPYDISCALEQHEALQCRGYTREDAARIALNVLKYALAPDVGAHAAANP